jgi:gas vesicle protein
MLDLTFRTAKLIIFKTYFMSSGKVMTGLFAGLAAGAILGILFAQDKGKETRKKISKKGTDLKGNIKAKFSLLVDDVVDDYENMKGKAGNLVSQENNKVKKSIDQAKETAVALADKAKEKADAWKNNDKQALS